jgi:DNA-binding NarL/FixJ family response regulator
MHCLIVEDHPVTLLGLKLTVKNHFPEFTISTAASPTEAMTCLAAAQVDVVLLDLIFEDQNGMTLLAQLQQLRVHTFPRTIVISGSSDAKTIEACKAHGAHGFVAKNTEPGMIAHVIRAVVEGDICFPASANMEERLTDGAGNCIRLTERQRDILDLVLAGYSNKKIAGTLNIGYGTVKNYMFDLMRLFSVKSRLELALKIQSINYKCRSGG